jgi:hypothetical protein
MHYLNRFTDILNSPYKDYEKAIKNNIKNVLDGNLSIGGCGVNKNKITIQYDGTILYCHDAIYHDFNKESSNKMIQLIRHYQNNSNFIPKGITEDWTYKQNFYTNHYVNSHFLSSVINQMTLLAKLNQINESYKNNPQKIMRHAFLLLHLTTCAEDGLITCGTAFGISTGMIRFYANGILDKIEEELCKKI